MKELVSCLQLMLRHLGPTGVAAILGVLIGGILTIAGGLLLDWRQARRDERRAARTAIADGERRVSRMISLARYGAQVTKNRDEEYKLSHACADEVDSISGLLYGGPGNPLKQAEKVLQRARDLTGRWQTIATRLIETHLTNADKDEWYAEIRVLADQICATASELRPLLYDAWPRR